LLLILFNLSSHPFTLSGSTETITTPGSPAGSYQEQAFKGLCSTFGFDPSSDPSLGQILREAISIQSHRPGDILLQPPEDYSPGDSSEYDSLSEPALFYVIQGQLQVHFLNEEEEKGKDKGDGRASKVPEFVANPGEMAGHLAAVTGEIYYKVIAAVGDGDVSTSSLFLFFYFCPFLFLVSSSLSLNFLFLSHRGLYILQPILHLRSLQQRSQNVGSID
jgi:hypothetical protein